jgi:hypothetical protein
LLVTALNISGGGTTPLYTFSKDRNFTNITRAENLTNIWILDPSTLSMGDNKIYVRMKTSATCAVTNTAIDSILLVRNAVTGITDPDMPGQIINIYPNPFRDLITLNGLNPSKSYTLRLCSGEGRELVTKHISGCTTYTITKQQYAQGIYWITLFDEKQKKLLGSVKLLKE